MRKREGRGVSCWLEGPSPRQTLAMSLPVHIDLMEARERDVPSDSGT